MLVIAMIVAVTLPVTLKKMNKVDTYSYYMGYKASKDISANALNSIIDLLKENKECHFIIKNVCYSKPFYPTSITKAVCETEKSTLGIKECYFDNDYWAGAVKKCGGIDKIPSLQHLADIANYIYGLDYNPNKQLGPWDSSTNLWFNTSRLAEVSFDMTNNAINNTTYVYGPERSHDIANVRYFAPTTSHISGVSRSNRVQTVCILGDVNDEEQSDKDNFQLLCEIIKEKYNIRKDNCNVLISSIQSAVENTDFTNVTPHIVFSNGLKLYIGNDFEEISELSDAGAEDNTGFALYIDVNGDSGKSKLYQDVFPFYLLKSGKVVAGYNPAVLAGANNHKSLSYNVIYDSYSGGNRTVKVLLKEADFKTAACAVGYITSLKYCDTTVKYDLCKESYRDCRIIVNEPFKIF